MEEVTESKASPQISRRVRLVCVGLPHAVLPRRSFIEGRSSSERRRIPDSPFLPLSDSFFSTKGHRLGTCIPFTLWDLNLMGPHVTMNSMTFPKKVKHQTAWLVVSALLLLLGCRCSPLRQAAVRDIAGIMTGPSGSRVFMQDNDPQLVRDALPFVLKTYEVLLASNPTDRDLLLASADGFVRYANAFVHADAERLEEVDLKQARDLRKRAQKLYFRGRDYALKGLGLDYPDFEKRLRAGPQAVLGQLSAKDVPLLFWTAAGWAGGISADVTNMALLAELPVVEAMMYRALQLDEDFDDGAIHELFVTFEGARSGTIGGTERRAIEHFDRFVFLTEGKKATAYVSLAASVAVRKQDLRWFEALLQKALAIDPDTVPRWRLENTLAQEKARWLLDRKKDLFFEYEEATP